MSLVEECVQVAEELDKYTTTSRGFVTGQSQGPQLNKLPEEDANQDEGESEAKSLAKGSGYWKTHTGRMWRTFRVVLTVVSSC